VPVPEPAAALPALAPALLLRRRRVGIVTAPT
jgi:hypothetical protein